MNSQYRFTFMKKTKESWQGQNKKGIPELRSAFESATSSEEMLKIFPKIEARLEEKQLGSDCWLLAQQLHDENQDPLKVLEFGKRALNILLNEENSEALGTQQCSMIIGSVLYLLGYACFNLKRYNESLGYLNWSDRNLSKLLLDKYSDDFVLENLHNTQLVLCKLKKAMGKGDEAVAHAKKLLDICVKIKEDGCFELGTINKDVCDTCLEVGKFEEALPYGLKALEIYEIHLDNDSEEVTKLRQSIVGIYFEMGEFEKALEQNRLSLSGLKSTGDSFGLRMAETAGGQMLLDLGRYEEAIEALKPGMSKSKNAGYQGIRALASMIMAKAYCGLKKFDDTRKYINIALRILEKKESNPTATATGFMEMSKLYQEMKEYEEAILLLQKAMDIPEFPKEFFGDSALRLFTLVFLSGTGKKRLSDLEEVVERMKEKFGPGHCYVGYGYEKLGRMYINLSRPKTAAKRLERARDILDASLGPYHSESLNACQTLSLAYARMRSSDLAIKSQENIIERFKVLGVSEQDNMDKAVQILNMIKG